MQIQDISIGYSKRTVATGISLTLNAGEFTCLIGENGCGKSTLLRTLAGFLPPLLGQVLLDGRSMAQISRKDLSKTIAVVLTERPDMPNTTVRQLVEMGRMPYTDFFGRLSAEDEKIVAESLKNCNVDEELAGKRLSMLSDGERQKAMIARALAQQTPYILLDEPTAFLDYPTKAETMLLLKHLAHEQGKTILLSTHDMEIALQTADRLILMSKGRETSVGTVRQLADSGALSEFLNRSQMRFKRDSLTIELK